MDHDKFEHDLMGYLFDELDEVTTAAVKRKLESDAACRELEAGLRATLQVSELTLDEPSDDLTERILTAATLASGGEPWHRRVARVLAWAGSHTMRPQFAMAAVLVLVLGSSLLLMRADPVATAIAPTIGPDTVDQNHEAASGRAGTAAKRDRGKPDMTASENDRDRTEQDYKAGLSHYRAGRHEEAQQALGAVAASDHHRAPSAALYRARSVRAHAGCRDALTRYEGLRSRHPNTSAAEDAAWEQADCHRALGQTARARMLWVPLRNSLRYRARADAALAQSADGSVAGDAVASRAPSPRASKKHSLHQPAPRTSPHRHECSMHLHLHRCSQTRWAQKGVRGHQKRSR